MPFTAIPAPRQREATGEVGGGSLEAPAEAEAAVERLARRIAELETALARLRTNRLIAILHYSPIEATVEGEPKEIYPFLGCSRLEEPLTRYPVNAVFHGHAHHGQPEGRTRTGAPVYNVSISLMRELTPEQPFRMIEIDMRASQPPPAEEKR